MTARLPFVISEPDEVDVVEVVAPLARCGRGQLRRRPPLVTGHPLPAAIPTAARCVTWMA